MSSDSTSTYNRNKSSTFGDNSKGKKLNIVQKEVRNLLASGASAVSVAELSKLRNKYKEDVVDEIIDAHADQLRSIRKKAKKFAKVILRKYSHLPLHKALKKALKYKVHYKLSDSEFSEFRRVYEQELTGYQHRGPSAFQYQRTRIGKVLGDLPQSDIQALRVGAKEQPILQDILQMYAMNKVLHSQVQVQSATYSDCAAHALNGQLRTAGNQTMTANPANHVHALVAAMFLPKFEILDEHMLFANIAYIVKCKHEKKPIMTKPDYELYYDMITDPNDVVCDIDSPLADLRNRVILQRDLWDAVLNLRNGRYYNHNLGNFLASVDNCRINMYDTPDLIYLKDEGAILRRLLSAFSFRPTIVSTLPIQHMVVENNPYVRPPTITNVTAIPMIPLRLPLNINTDDVEVSLDDALNQAHWYLENGTIVAKNQSIIYSKGILVFYINRRYQALNVARMMRPQSFTRLPRTIAGFEKLNDKAVKFSPVMNIMNTNYNLRSVVLVESQQISPKTEHLITGTTAAIMKHRDLPNNVSDRFYYYDPLGAALDNNTTNTFTTNAPITSMPRNKEVAGENEKPFMECAQTQGTVFFYEKVDTGSDDNPWYFGEN